MRSKIPQEANDMFRHLTPTEEYLKNLEKYNFNMYHPTLFQRNDLLALKLSTKKWSKKF